MRFRAIGFGGASLDLGTSVSGILQTHIGGKELTRGYKGRLVSLAGQLLSLALLVWLFAGTVQGYLHAQEFRASITGQVADSTGAAIPGASITALNVETRVPYSTKSDAQGEYALLYLLPGQYTITVDAKGFQSMTYNNVVLNSAQQLGLNVSLKPGSVAQQIVVTAGSVDLDTVSASTGGVVDQMKVDNMPTPGMQVFDEIVLTQGIRSTGMPFNLTPRNNGNNYVQSGAQVDEGLFLVNGAPVSDQGNWYFVPSQDSTGQVQAFAMPYDAQYGRSGGGAFSANIKGGTADYHGSVYEYYGDQVTDANKWQNNLTGTPKSANRRDTWGATSGGPIRKGKIYYFGSYERFWQSQPTIKIESVPLPTWIQGNFQGSGYTIYDPTSTTCASTNASGGCTSYTRTAFQNDEIPQTDISPIGQAILSYYPAPNVPNPGTVNNYIYSTAGWSYYDQFIGRIDENISDATRLYGLFTLENNANYGASNGFSNAALTDTNDVTRDYNVILDLTHIVSPTKVLDFKGSYGHNSGMNYNGMAIKDNLSPGKVGFNMPAVATVSNSIVPALTVTNMASLFGDTDSGTMDADADFKASATQLIGHHNLHYGAEFMDIQTSPTGTIGTPYGAFTFNSTYTQQNPLAAKTGQGNEIADLLLGVPSSGSIGWSTPIFVTMHYFGLFLQDDFQMRPNLTLNLGLRWDVNTSPRDRHNRINAGFCLTCTNPYTSQINAGNSPNLQAPLLGGLEFAGVNGEPSAPFAVQWHNWEPRVGFSWGSLSNTVIRGGYGIFYPWSSLAVDDTGFSQTTSYVASLDGGLTPSTYFQSGKPYPNGAIAPTGSSEGLETNAGNAITYGDVNRGLRMTQHWSLGVQRRFPGALLLDVQYLGTTVHSIPVDTSLDVITTTEQQACLADLSICNTNVTNPFYGVLPASTALGASATIPSWELMRAYPLFNGVTENQVPSGDSHYNALAVRVERRLKNLDMVFNYTYSNWMDRDSYLNNGSFRDAALSKGLDPNDVRNYFITNVVYPLPSVFKSAGVLNIFANHWIVATTFETGTGFPLSLPSANFTCSSYAPAGGQTRAHWFNNNESCWQPLSTWQPRTTPLYIGFLRQPPLTFWNGELHKDFPLKWEGMVAQFRAICTNLANHPTFGAPSTTVATAPTYSPTTSWAGLGTLPTTESDVPRSFLLALKVTF